MSYGGSVSPDSTIMSSGSATPPTKVPLSFSTNVVGSFGAAGHTGKLMENALGAASEISGALLADIKSTHSPKTSQVNLKPIFQLVENICLGADGSFKATPAYGKSDAMPKLDDGMSQVLDDIHETSCKVSCNHSGDIEKTPMEVLEVLAGYDWSAKVVLATAAFASLFGEFWLLARLRSEDLLAKSLDFLRGYPQIPDVTVLNKLLKTVTDVVETNYNFSKSPACDIMSQVERPAVKDALEYFPEATYQIIRGIVHLSSILGKKVDADIGLTMNIIETDFTKINGVLEEKLDMVRRDGEIPEAYDEIGRIISTKDQIKIIAKFMYIDEQQVPENLKNKHVLFLVSNLEISVEELDILSQFSSKDYGMIWLPIDDDELTIDEKTRFTELKSKWKNQTAAKIHNEGTVVHKFIKTEWKFIKHPITVSLNSHGELAVFNVLPMLLTWGSDAFPFTVERENELWKTVDEQYGWKLEFLVPDMIDRTIWSWGQSTETFVCLFGGENTTWIQNFTTKVKEVTSRTAANVPLKLAYVGGNRGKGVPRNKLDQDIHVMESKYRFHFWHRLDSILHTKSQNKKRPNNDRVMREVMNVLNYAGDGGEWVTFSMGSEVMITTNGETALTAMSKYNDWKAEAERTSFFQALKAYVNKLPAVHGCVHVNVPVIGHVPEPVSCPQCSKQMEMYYAYRCCV